MKKRLAAILKWVGISILALAVIYAGLMIWSAHKLRQAYAALEKDGRPMTMAQLIPPRLSDTRNAAPVYQASILLLKSKSVEVAESSYGDLFHALEMASDSILSDPPSPDAPAAAKMLQKWLQDPDVAMILRQVEVATAKPCQYKIVDYAKGTVDVRQLHPLKCLADILCAKARWQAGAGDTAGAWATVICSLRLSDSLKSEAILTGQFAYQRAGSVALKTIQHLARNSLPTPEQRQELDKLLLNLDSTRSLVSALDGDRLTQEQWLFKNDIDLGQRTLNFIVSFSPLGKFDQAVYLDICRQYANAAGQPYSAKTLNGIRDRGTDIPRCCVLSRMITHQYYGAIREFTEFRALAEVTRTGLATLDYRQANGKYPQSLAEAGVTEIRDPFTGKPLFYKLTEQRFIIYSAGENQKDDGGNDSREPGRGKYDIVWKVQAGKSE